MWPRTVFSFLIIFAVLAILLWPKDQNALQGRTASIPDQASLITYPTRLANGSQPPRIVAESAIILDAAGGQILYEKNSQSRHQPASIVKLVTALTVLENCPQDLSVTVNLVTDEPFLMGLSIGDRLTVENLLYGLLMASANDAAYALATACSQSPEQFVAQMNQQAQRLTMTNSHFVNPAGFDDQNQYTTAFDLAKLAKAAVANPLIAKIVATKNVVVTDNRGIKTYYLKNTNELLGKVNGLQGVKTGQTQIALGNLVTATTRDGNTIIAVVLGSEDRFGDSQKLIEWAFENYQWIGH